MISKILDKFKQLTLPGFNGVPLYRVIKFILEEVGQDSIHNRASAAAFNILLATFPTLLLFFSIIAYIPIQDFSSTLMDFTLYLLPFNAQEVATKAVEEIIKTSSGSGGTLSLGVLLTLYFASNGIRSLMMALSDRPATIFYQRHFLKRILVSMGFTLVLFFVIILSVVAILVGQYLIEIFILSFNIQSSFTVIGLHILHLLIAFILIYNIVALVYWLTPVVESAHWGFLSPGTAFAALSSVIFLKLFGYFVNTFGNYDKLYGSLGASMVLMVCFYSITLVLIIGFELNVGIKNHVE